ncbi:MAG TPA: hypothetical protein EYP57_02435 [Thermodesulfobacteriaceae bacterium]|nr:hypothetical protein [Thermodesulfobacteriaceae bacterium]
MSGDRRRTKRFLDREPLTVKPFSGLKQALDRSGKWNMIRRPGRKFQNGSSTAGGVWQGHSRGDESEEAVFLRAVADVVPLERGRNGDTPAAPSTAGVVAPVGEDDMSKGLRELQEIINGNRLLPVHNTPEYVEDFRPRTDPCLAARLRRGDFAVQAYCELHGLTSFEALEVCDEFMSESLAEGRKCIAFIHGRGLSSAREPVLKGSVIKWITRGPFRRFILSFSSAPIWDGGAGVTYVLLSRRPVKRKRRGM